MNQPRIIPVCLTIAGLDPSGGAGITADIKTFTAFGCFAASAVTSVTFQNTQGVYGAAHQTAESVRGQVDPVFDDFEVAALKTGMLPKKEVIEEIAQIIKEREQKNIVVDPVVRSTSGYDLIDDAALRSVIEELFPLSSIITPNLPESERIAAMKIESESDVYKAAELMRLMGAKNVLIKGGHLFDPGNSNVPKKAKDFLFTDEGVTIFEADWIETRATHGTGCTLAAAITANLALGKSVKDAVSNAKDFVHRAILNSPNLGHGASPIGVEFREK